MIKCNVCGNEFEPTKEEHYISRDEENTGVVNVISKYEATAYDTFDCPKCGCQCRVQERKRVFYETANLKNEEIVYIDQSQEACPNDSTRNV